MHTQACTHPHQARANVVLAVSLSEKDQHALAMVFDALPWRLKFVGGLSQGLRKALSCIVRLVICERDLPEGDWKLLFHPVRALTQPPRFIVVSHFADERLWAEALNLGGYDVLATPFDAEGLRRVVSHAMNPVS